MAIPATKATTSRNCKSPSCSLVRLLTKRLQMAMITPVKNFINLRSVFEKLNVANFISVLCVGVFVDVKVIDNRDGDVLENISNRSR